MDDECTKGKSLTSSVDSVIEGLDKEVHALVNDVRLINDALLPPHAVKKQAEQPETAQPKGWFKIKIHHLRNILEKLHTLRINEIGRLREEVQAEKNLGLPKAPQDV